MAGPLRSHWSDQIAVARILFLSAVLTEPVTAGDTTGTSFDVIHRQDDALGWIAYPDEKMERASYALTDSDRDGIWLVDPVDCDGLDELLRPRGPVLGVVIALDRHKRDAVAIATRHEVPIYRPTWMQSIDDDLDGPVRALGGELGATGFELSKRIDNRFWKEVVLYRPSDATVYVPESVGAAAYFCVGDEPVGVHPMLRLTPPAELTDRPVERLFMGHGHPIGTDATEPLVSAIDTARQRFPGLLKQLLSSRLG